MATWNSNLKIKWDCDMGMSFVDCENSWSYQTVSDFLTIKTVIGEYSDFSNHAATEIMKLYSKNEALALLETLIDWAEIYEGEGVTEDIIKTLKEKRK